MAIRPTDLQIALIAQTASPPLQQRAETTAVIAQGAAQAEFVAKTQERTERVAETTDLKGNRIEVGDREQDRQEPGGQGRKRERKPGDPFEEVVDEAAGLADGPAHLIDFSA